MRDTQKTSLCSMLCRCVFELFRRALWVSPLVGACIFLWPDSYTSGGIPILIFAGIPSCILGSVVLGGGGSVVWFDLWITLVFKLRIKVVQSVDNFEVLESKRYDVVKRNSKGRRESNTYHFVRFRYEVNGQQYWADYDDYERNLPEMFQSPSEAYDWSQLSHTSKSEEEETSNVIGVPTSLSEARSKYQPYLLCLAGNHKRHYFGVKQSGRPSHCDNISGLLCSTFFFLLLVCLHFGLSGALLYWGLAIVTQSERSITAFLSTIAVMYVTWSFFGVVNMLCSGYREASTTEPPAPPSRPLAATSIDDVSALKKCIDDFEEKYDAMVALTEALPPGDENKDNRLTVLHNMRQQIDALKAKHDAVVAELAKVAALKARLAGDKDAIDPENAELDIEGEPLSNQRRHGDETP